MERLLEEALAAGAWGSRPGSSPRPATSPTPTRSGAGPRAAAPRRRLLRRTSATKPITSSRRCARPSPWPRPPASTCRSRTSSSRARQLGRRRPAARARSRRRGRRGAARGLRPVSVRHRHQSAAQPAAALGHGGRHPGDAGAAAARASARAHPRGNRARRPQQLRPHPLLGRRAGRHLAARARGRGPHVRRYRAARAASIRSTPSATTSSRTGARPASSITSMSRRGRAGDHARAVGARGLRRQRARHDRRDGPGQAAPALLRHPRARSWAPASATSGCSRCPGRPQDDGRLGRGPRAARPRAAAGGDRGRTCRLRSRAIADRATYEIRTGTRSASSRSSSTARS